ncbi:hypothetical protein M1O54_03450 [Dehalococcoidia bacterium]|nr:hypothetical protein [Dehalococcoidia bacterium]
MRALYLAIDISVVLEMDVYPMAMTLSSLNIRLLLPPATSHPAKRWLKPIEKVPKICRSASPW